MPNTTWLDSIENPTEKKITHVRNKAKSNETWTFPLFLLVVVMAVANVGAVVWKRQHKANLPQASDFFDAKLDLATKSDLEQFKVTQAKMWERVKWNTDILTLKSIVDNHNLVVVQNGYPKSDYIYFNHDWTINRVPNHVKLSPEDKAFVEKYVRKSN